MSKGIVFTNSDSILAEINSIKNLERVDIYDLTSFKLYDSRKILIPTIHIVYDGTKILNMCSRDKYFDLFALKVQEVYLKETEKFKVDKEHALFGQTNIIIDEKSKKVLLSGILSKNVKNDYLYSDDKSYSHSLFFEKDDLECMIPLVKYHIKELFDKTNLKVNFPNEDEVYGYKKRYSIGVTVDGISDRLIISYDKDNRGYYFDIRSDNVDLPHIKQYITISPDKIDVKSYIKERNILLENTYDFINNPTIKERLFLDGDLYSYTRNDLKSSEVEHENLISITGDFNGVWYKLPWNAYFGISEEIDVISELEKVTKRESKYLSLCNDRFLLHEDSNKKCVRDRTIHSTGSVFELDRLKRVIKGKRLDEENYVIETVFSVNINDTNKQYFYHIAKVDNIDEITKDNLFSVSKDENVIYSGDLYDTSNIRKVLGKGK